MFKTSSVNRGTCLILVSCAIFLFGCSQQSAGQLSGVWRAEDAVAGKNLVMEFVPGGTGKVFSGSIIGFPTDASFEWQMQGDQITIETVGDDPVTQTMTVLSQYENSFSVRVNRTDLTLVRIDEIIDDDAGDLLSPGDDDQEL